MERWTAQPTAGHKIHGQSVVYSDTTGKDIAIVYDGAAHASLVAAAPELRDVLREIASYLDLKAEQYAMDYDENHAIRLTCDRMREAARAALESAA